MQESFDYIVLGGGVAGLCAHSLLCQHKVDSLLIEQHSLLGGCASYYQRRGHIYDVGATTLTGVGLDRPLGKFFRRLQLEIPFHKCTPAQIIVQQNKKIIRYPKLDDWLEQLYQHFPGHDHKVFWSKLYRDDDKLWSMVFRSRDFPPQGLRGLRRLMKGLQLDDISLGLGFFEKLKNKIPKSYLHDQSLMAVLDEQLLISTQTTSDDVSYALGVLGLCYPRDQVYLLGGMKSFIKAVEQTLAPKTIMRGQRVVRIEQESTQWRVWLEGRQGRKRSFLCQHLLSSLPHWNMAQLSDDKVKKYFSRLSQSFPAKWSAMSAYGSVKLQRTPQAQYFQVHSLALKEWLGHEGSFFISLSRGEKLRSKDGFTTITVSTHIDIDHFEKKIKNQDYQEIKKQFLSIVLEVLLSLFEDYGACEWTQFEVGTPLTFDRYTARYKGCVGGIPHAQGINPLRYPKANTPFKGLYRLGDTTFPGQGVVGVLLGSMNVVDNLLES